MKRTYITPIMMIDEMRLTNGILDNSAPHVNDDGNVDVPGGGGGGEGGNADDGCAKEINEFLEEEKDPFDGGLW